MATTYRLPCEGCGQHVPVETRQAGSTVGCACGATLDVPPLRELQSLDPLEPVAENKASSQRHANWSIRQGIFLVGLIIAIPAGGFGVFWLVTMPHRDLDAKIQYDQEMIDAMPLSVTWQFWQQEIEGLALSKPNYPWEVAHRRQLSLQWMKAIFAFVAAGIGVLISLSALFYKPASYRRMHEEG